MVEGKGIVGLNETAFGLAPPLWLSKMLIDLAGRRKAEHMIMHGQLISAAEAHECGLVDSLVPLSRLADESQARLAELLNIPDKARGMAKQGLRFEAAEALRSKQSEDLDWFVSLVSSPEVQTRIAKHLESLSSKKKKAE